MRIPPYYNEPGWQRFFAGMAIGALIGWIIFLFIYGTFQEEQSREIEEQETKIAILEEEKKIWQEDYKKLNKENKKRLTLQEIKIKIENGEKYNLGDFTVFQIEKAVKEDISHLIAKDIESVYNSRELLVKTIENKEFELDDKQYKVQVKEILFFTTLYINLEIRMTG